MRSQLAVVFLASLAALAPSVVASHPVAHAPANETEAVAALVEMASDGYVVHITRASERVFEVRVLHLQELTRVAGQTVGAQFAFDRVEVLAPAGNDGLWLHALRVDPIGILADLDPAGNIDLPTKGYRPEQTLIVKSDLGGTFLEVTITEAFVPTFQGAVNAVVGIEAADADGDKDWVRGLYNVAKLAAPVDALDAVAQPVRIV